MSDAVLYEDSLVRVTPSAVQLRGGSSYFLSQISSVHVAKETEWGMLLIAIPLGVLGIGILMSALSIAMLSLSGTAMAANSDGTAIALSGLGSALVCGVPPGIALIAVSVYLIRSVKTKYWLLFATSAGQVRAFWNYDHEAILRIQTAIIQAMSQRR